MNWPPRKCDLAILDYFLWSTLKDQCYTNNPEMINTLKAYIVRAIREVETETLTEVLNNSCRNSQMNKFVPYIMKIFFYFEKIQQTKII